MAKTIPPQVNEQHRRHMIEEAAYFRAAHRGFQGGDPMADWIAAEAQVDEQLRRSDRQREEELTAYRKMREEVEARLGEIKERVSANAIRQAVDRASRNLKDVGEHSMETINRVGAAVRKDLASTAERLGPSWDSLSDKTAGLFEVWRDRGSEFIGAAGKASGEWLRQLRGKTETTYYTGELTSGGQFECLNCGERFELSEAGHLPECPNCHEKKFRQV